MIVKMVFSRSMKHCLTFVADHVTIQRMSLCGFYRETNVNNMNNFFILGHKYS